MEMKKLSRVKGTLDEWKRVNKGMRWEEIWGTIRLKT